MTLLGAASLPLLIAVFVGAAAAIAVAGVRLAHVADTLADRTGMGEIIAGAVFVGASTSLPGVITSITTALDGYPQLSISNALGGLTAQTTFLVVADIFYRRANLEHAAASATALAQAALLMTMLAVPLLAMSGPQITIFHIHPASLALFVIYAAGVRLLGEINARPMWRPVRTAHTASEEEQAKASPVDKRSDARLWLAFLVAAGITGAAGFLIGQSSIGLVNQTGLSQTAFGALFTAIATSLPELVTAIAAVRIGALNLAFGDVIGGNAFEVLFLAAADFAWLDGSIYAEFTPDHVFLTMTVILMTGVLLLGLLHREQHGIANIGWEGAAILGLYAMSAIVLFL